MFKCKFWDENGMSNRTPESKKHSRSTNLGGRRTRRIQEKDPRHYRGQDRQDLSRCDHP